MSYRHRNRRYARKKYMRQRTAGPVADWKGVFAGRSPNPDTLYTQVMQEFTSDELWGAASPGKIFVNQNMIFQPNPAATTAYPHAVCVNSPKLQMMYPEASPGFRERTTNWIDINRWATYYEYCTMYQTDIVLEIGNVYSLDAGWNPYGQGEDAYYVYYSLPNVDIPPAAAGTAFNPWGISNTATPVSTVMRTPKILRKKLPYPNTTGISQGATIRIRWKLKDVGSPTPNYMMKSVSSNSNGTAWNEPVDRTGFDTGLGTKRHFFYFWMGTDNVAANNNVLARWKMKIYSKVKFWQPRATALAPTLSFKTGEEEQEEEQPEPPQYEEMQTDSYESVPSTPVIEQLTRELSMFGNAKVSAQKPLLKRT